MSRRRTTIAKLVLAMAGLLLLIVSVGADWIGLGGTPGLGERQIAMLVPALAFFVTGGGWMLVDWLRASRVCATYRVLARFQADSCDPSKGGLMVGLAISSIVVIETVLTAGFFVSDTLVQRKSQRLESRLMTWSITMLSYSSENLAKAGHTSHTTHTLPGVVGRTGES